MEFSFGNNKLPDTTLIFNMGSAERCPSRALGICETVNSGIKCYALKAEQQYKKNVPNYRNRQEIAWKESTAEQIATLFSDAIKRRKKKTKHIRFNESGDFWSQEDINKLNYIAERMKKEHGITTYGYSARRDLDFSSAKFSIKGSGWNPNNNGSTCVVNSDQDIPKDYVKCPGSCKSCSTCCEPNKINIAFIKH